MEEEKKLVVKEGPRLTICGGGDGRRQGGQGMRGEAAGAETGKQATCPPSPPLLRSRPRTSQKSSYSKVSSAVVTPLRSTQREECYVSSLSLSGLRAVHFSLSYATTRLK